jgi:hypothetical protein
VVRSPKADYVAVPSNKSGSSNLGLPAAEAAYASRHALGNVMLARETRVGSGSGPDTHDRETGRHLDASRADPPPVRADLLSWISR